MTNYEIMHGEKLIVTITAQGQCRILLPAFLPWNLYLEETDEFDGRLNNITNFYYWCATRVLTLDRKYAKQILNSMGMSQATTDKERAQIALSYHCLTLSDIYWVREAGEDISFAQISLYENHLNNAFVDISLRGRQLTVGNAFLCGIFTAGAVLANPYAVTLFILYGAACVIAWFRERKDKERGKELKLLDIRSFFFMGVGAFCIFVLFVIFVFSRASLSEIMESFSYIVMDTERKKPFLEKFAKYFIRIHRYYKGQVYVTAVLLAAWVLDQKKRIPRWLYLTAEIAAAVPYVVLYGFFGYSSIVDVVGINYIMIPLSFLGLVAYVTTEEKDRQLFWCWYLPGLFYTIPAHFATDTGILTVSASYMIPSAASILLIWKAIREQDHVLCKNAVRGLFCVLLALQFTSCLYLRMVYVWGDEHMPHLTAVLEEGPLQGIHTSTENEALYQDVLDDMDDLQLTKEDKLFVIGIAPWMYLNTDAECAAYSTWMTQETDPLIPLYYELHPEKLPTVIYCYEYDESILDTEFAQSFLDKGYVVETMRRGIVLTNR